MVKVKICGLTNREDAFSALEAGADALGFIIYEKSKRFIKAIDVRHITAQLPPFVTKVGVFVNEDPRRILEILSYAHLDFAQLHGDESPEVCEYIGASKVIKAFRLRTTEEVEKIRPYIGKVKAILLDTFSRESYGGTGKTFDWNIAKAVKETFPDTPLILSGGLNPDNVHLAVKEIKPFAVDVSSGVEESPGKKDSKKIKAFLRAAKCG